MWDKKSYVIPIAKYFEFLVRIQIIKHKMLGCMKLR